MVDFYTEIYINASTDKVWKAFVTKDQFFKAYFGADIISSFQIGERIEFSGMYEGNEAVHIYGKILEYEKGRLLAYTDHPGPMYNENHANLESRVKVNFNPLGESTQIALINDRFSENNPMKDEAKQWYLILSNLKTWIETGHLMNLPKQ